MKKELSIIKRHNRLVKRLHKLENKTDDAFTSEQLIGAIFELKWVLGIK